MALLERFFTQRLMQQRQASPHTISSYRDCFHQFLKFTDYAFILLAMEMDDPAKREELLQAMAHGSAAAWGHLNLLGEYDFSEDKLQDTVGIKPQNWRTKQAPISGAENRRKFFKSRRLRKIR